MKQLEYMKIVMDTAFSDDGNSSKMHRHETYVEAKQSREGGMSV